MPGGRVGDRTTLLIEACEMGLSIFTSVAALENAEDSDDFHTSLTGRSASAATIVPCLCK